jgi:hypothetical protein
MKRLLSLLLVFVMIFAFAVPTFAATDKKGTVAKEETIKVTYKSLILILLLFSLVTVTSGKCISTGTGKVKS